MPSATRIELLRQKAEAFAQTLTDLPQGWYVTTSTESREFTLKWKHPVFASEFLLGKIRVGATRPYLCYDRRAQVRVLMTKPEGFRREAMFFDALKERTDGTPEWFLYVERVGQFLDRRGIDALARIRVREAERIKVPIQIKSSEHLAAEYYERWPEYYGVVWTIVVKGNDSPDILRTKVYSLLQELRDYILKEDIAVSAVKSLITERLYPKRAA